MPFAQSGLLADAMKFTGELSVEPFAGDVTVTTGVVAKASSAEPIRKVTKLTLAGNI
jgi:hypothetical protein